MLYLILSARKFRNIGSFFLNKPGHFDILLPEGPVGLLNGGSSVTSNFFLPIRTSHVRKNESCSGFAQSIFSTDLYNIFSISLEGDVHILGVICPEVHNFL